MVWCGWEVGREENQGQGCFMYKVEDEDMIWKRTNEIFGTALLLY